MADQFTTGTDSDAFQHRRRIDATLKILQGYGFSGLNGSPGATGLSGTSGFSGASGLNGGTAASGFSGTSGYSGTSGISGISGFSGVGISGTSGFSGTSGYSGTSGTSGYSGTSGTSGFSGAGLSGFSGTSGISGTNGVAGASGVSGFSGSGISGFSGTGLSGYSGFSGLGAGGDVVGPSSSTDNAITRFDLTTGKLIQNSVLIVDDTGNITGPAAGFKITGGTGTTADLSFQTTNGVGTTGGDMHFLVGNNGGIEAMSILNDGSFNYSMGDFSTSGDAQRKCFISRNTTTNNTQTELFTNGSSTQMVLPNDTTWKFTINISARRTDVDGESSGWTFEGVIDRNTNAASTALAGTVSYDKFGDTVTWTITVDADATNGALRILVTGENSKTIKWVASSDIIQTIG